MQKKIISRVLCLFIALVLSSCGDDNKEKKKYFDAPSVSQSNDPNASQGKGSQYRWSDYIALNTQGFISKKDRISVSFLSPIIEQSQVGTAADDFIRIEPNIDASISFISQREIEIIPKKDLNSGQSYQVTVATDQLKGFPKELGQYEFKFSVIKQAFELMIDSLTANEAGDRLTIEGRVTTADIVDATALEEMLQANYLGQRVNLEWQHQANGKQHSFMIKDLPRHKQSESLNLAWDANKIQVADVGERKIEIPAIGDFKVANIRAVQTDRQQIEISFTDQLLASQNLTGLISLGTQSFTARVEGNLIKVYPEGVFQGELQLVLDQGIKSKSGFKLGKRVEKSLVFLSEKPQVKFVGKGVILPKANQLTVPFEAVNVDSVQVTVFQIFANNMGQFLQNNSLQDSYESYRVGRHLWRKRIALSSPVQDTWNRYQLDVSELLSKYPGALLRITLSINRSNSLYSCSEQENAIPVPAEAPLTSQEEENEDDDSYWDYADNYYNSGNIQWTQRNNPCNDSYYRYSSNIKAERNFMASNIGIIAKRASDKKLLLTTTDLQLGKPLAAVDLEIYNFQNQLLAETTSDQNGLASLQLHSIPFYAKAVKGDQVGYLKLSKGLEIPTSHFDVGGLKISKGIKGYIYGERGVWRPGDDIHLTFVLQDLDDRIPAGHPVTLDFFNPKGQLITSVTNNSPVDDFYSFKLATQEKDMTGNWKVIAKLGGAHFQKRIKIEAVIPNRLKVELTTKDNPLLGFKMPISGKLFSQWLHGAKASNLKADISVKFRPTKTRFNQFSDYNYDDPAREFNAEKQEVYSDYLDDEGNMSFQVMLRPKGRPAGMLNAFFTSRVFEQGGAFSSESQKIPYHPYRHYVGIKLPKGDAKRNMLLTDTPHKVSIATLDAFGEKVSIDQLEVTLYKIDWKWWWDKSGESLAKYVSAYRNAPIERGQVSTREGVGEWQFEIKYPQWGRYMVRVCDPQGGHCSGQVFYIDWPGWAGRAKDQKGIGASVINLSADKEEYQVGETATITLPASKQGHGLVTIENGSRVIDRYWVELTEQNKQIQIPLTAEMSPNIYVSLSLIQPHQGKNNDLPIRLFGILPIKVVDPQTKLSPQIQVADELRPQSVAEIKVSEAEGKAMTYSLAIVDEGLLGLTRFRTPDLHSYFYQKEALGVKTWDMFDQVVGAYGGELERILALGGDESLDADDASAKKKRFPPVVRVLGPFHLDVGEVKTHQVDIPQYLGAVRVMLVAGYQGAYGLAKKSVLVRQSLNLLATVPRVVGPDEDVTIPVAVFVNEKALGEVKISVEHSDHFEWLDGKAINLKFDQPGDQLGLLRFKVKSKLGQGRLKFTATIGELKSEQEIYIDVRSANPKTYRQITKVLTAGERWNTEYQPHGMPMTNSAVLEFSRVPPLNLESRLAYLIHYPHGCVEQTTSAVFPQVFLPDLVNLENDQADKVENNVANGIEKLRAFQLTSGGFSYWPGQNQPHIWATNYVGEFLLAAKNKGYEVPASMLAAWTQFQQSAAASWTTGNDLAQSYRLYLLALAGEPAIGAMNRLRERDRLATISRWYLAAAYQKIGQSDAAKSLVANLTIDTVAYDQIGVNLNSQLRDQAIMLQSLLLLDDKTRSDKLVKAISDQLSSGRWLGTQETAMALNAMYQYISGSEVNGQQQDKIKVAYKLGDQGMQLVTSDKPIWKSAIKAKENETQPILINNQSGGDLYVTLHSSGIPKPGNEKAEQQGLAIEVGYLSKEGYAKDVSRLTQGSDIKVLVVVRNDTGRDFKYLALTQILPSGWEIHHPAEAAESKMDPLEYRDIRDDRVLTYFGLKKHQQKEFEITINAAYLGKFYLPAFKVEAMYDATKYARSKGQWVEVVQQN